jgi:hypothetical protein
MCSILSNEGIKTLAGLVARVETKNQVDCILEFAKPAIAKKLQYYPGQCIANQRQGISQINQPKDSFNILPGLKRIACLFGTLTLFPILGLRATLVLRVHKLKLPNPLTSILFSPCKGEVIACSSTLTASSTLFGAIRLDFLAMCRNSSDRFT